MKTLSIGVIGRLCHNQWALFSLETKNNKQIQRIYVFRLLKKSWKKMTIMYLSDNVKKSDDFFQTTFKSSDHVKCVQSFKKI